MHAQGKLPPGPRRPPVIQTIAWWARPIAFFEQSRARYGKRFTIRLLGAPPFVMIADPDEVKQIFTAAPEVLHPGEGAQILEPVVGRNSVILLDESEHLQQRKLMLPAFHGEKMQRLAGTMQEVADHEVASWPSGQPIELHRRFQALTMEVILRAVFGLDAGPQLDGLRSRLTDLLADSSRPASMVPALQRGRGWRRFERIRGEADQLIFDLIDRRRSEQTERDDILSMLVGARHEDGTPMSHQELRDELMTLLVAGHETTASELAWAFERLARAPDVVARLHEEVDADAGDEYVTATIQETLRRRPVLPNAAPRLVKQPIEIGGWEYPPGRLPGRERLPDPSRPGHLPGPLCLPAGALRRRVARHLHVDPVRRRSPPLPGRELRAPGDEDRAEGGALALRRRAGHGGTRADPPPGHHDQPRTRSGHRAARALACAGASRSRRGLARHPRK